MQPNDLAAALRHAWHQFNKAKLGAALRQPLICLDHTLSGKRLLGLWEPSRRAIRISETFARSSVWLTVVEVLHHEIAHQYVSEVLLIDGEETAHGPAFQMICERYGIDGRACAPVREEDKARAAKVQKLMNLTQSPNENEAKAALAAARRIMGEHPLDDLNGATEDDVATIPIGAIYQKLPLHAVTAANILAEEFAVLHCAVPAYDPRTQERGQQIEITGRRSALEQAQHFHACMDRQATGLANAAGLANTKKARADYLAGLYASFRDHLCDAKKGATSPNQADGAALVRVGPSDPEVGDHFEARYSHLRTSRRKVPESAAYAAGRRDGKGGPQYNKPLAAAAGVRMLGRGQ